VLIHREQIDSQTTSVMIRTATTLLGSLVLAAWVAQTSAATEQTDALSLHRVLAERCHQCHGGEKTKGKVDLVGLSQNDSLIGQPALIEDILAVLLDYEMPPEDEPELPPEVRAKMISELEELLESALALEPFAPTPIRRMNRFQYNNAVVDLLELDRDIFQLNERLLRRYDDYFLPSRRKMPEQVAVASRPLSKDIDGRRPEGFRGVAPFPQDQRAEHGFDNRADHLTLSPLLMESFLTLSQTIVESPDLNPDECGSWNWLFAKPGEEAVQGPIDFEAENEAWLKQVTQPKGNVRAQGMQGWGPHWGGDKQLFWICLESGLEFDLSFKITEMGEGLRIGFTKAADYGKFELSLDNEVIGKPLDLYSPTVVRSDDVLIPLTIKPGVHRLKIKCIGKNKKSKNYLFGMDTFEVSGMKKEPPKPLLTDDSEAIRIRIEKILRRAFRRPAPPETLDRFVHFAENNLAAGISFEETMRTVVGAILATPDFLYFYETKDPETEGATRVDDFELASRLALFLWGSIPDDALLDLASSGKLSDTETLSAQIDRMLNDKRSRRFCDSFPVQWLQLDRLISAVPDPKKYPYFYYNGYRVSMHMMLEPLLLFDTVFIEDRSIIDLLAPDFTWQSDMLEANYEGKARGRANKILKFKRVPLTDPHRGGVITNAAVMTMTSSPLRTQPITRGAWVNAVIFNEPPEPPPADVPPLPEADEEALKNLTIRERLAAHRERKDCAGCHNQMDPFGFALENFGPTGIWRDTYENGRAVDTSGILFNRYEFETLDDFKGLILKEKRRFIRGFIAHLLSYGLGRELGPADSPSIDEITERAIAGEDQLRTLLKRVAMSEPFLHKNPQDITEDAEDHEP